MLNWRRRKVAVASGSDGLGGEGVEGKHGHVGGIGRVGKVLEVGRNRWWWWEIWVFAHVNYNGRSGELGLMGRKVGIGFCKGILNILVGNYGPIVLYLSCTSHHLAFLRDNGISCRQEISILS